MTGWERIKDRQILQRTTLVKLHFANHRGALKLYRQQSEAAAENLFLIPPSSPPHAGHIMYIMKLSEEAES